MQTISCYVLLLVGKVHLGTGEGWGLGLVSFKPIFHCDAKLLALGIFASPDAQDDTFALPDARIPTYWYLLH